ncbi:Pleckstrin homology-like domain family B member 2 [Labeo rohita]|uniref:Pleckstrin homology-like domain family B member 2 n=1 Tax=Labeo rohita TaxID=84645 RepID=A0ABQ8MII2_LABRO|nr:Pleckstrin homology-like domain family B member 2 [Labeo rohita]
MPRVQAPKEAVLPQLKGIEYRLQRNLDQVATYQEEIVRLQQVGYISELTPEQAQEHLIAISSHIRGMFHQSKDNPEDDITKRKSLCDIGWESRWNKGPTFLRQPTNSSPDMLPLSTFNQDSELRKLVFWCLQVSFPSPPDLQQYQTYPELLKENIEQSLDMDEAFYSACVDRPHSHTTSNGVYFERLRVRLFHKNEVYFGIYIRHANGVTMVTPAAGFAVFHQVQSNSFPEKLSCFRIGKSLPKYSCLLCFSPEFDDVTKLICVEERLHQISQLEEHLVVFDSSHPITKQIIKDCDDQLHHPGPDRLFAELQRKFWVIMGLQQSETTNDNAQVSKMA